MNSETSLRKRRDRSPYGFEDLNRFRIALTTLRQDLSKSFEDLSGTARRTLGEALGDLSSLPLHPGDRASEVSEHQMALAFLARAEQEATEIDDALERIDNRSFGLCEACDRAIPLARLLAIPFARHCVTCKRSIERGPGSVSAPARTDPLPPAIRAGGGPSSSGTGPSTA
jgi:RNA polymerase-binding protein DksA